MKEVSRIHFDFILTLKLIKNADVAQISLWNGGVCWC